MKMYLCLNCGKENLTTRQKINKYCDNTCQAEYQFKKYIEEWQHGTHDGSTGRGGEQVSKHIRKFLRIKFNDTCCCCGLTAWNGQPITLEVEHIDGDFRNNKEDNLILLCPNCHSQTPTYKAKNKGNGRPSRTKSSTDSDAVLK